MTEETRSLWEQLDSEVEPWRRGRAVLITFAVCCLLLQGLIVVAHILNGNLEGLIGFGSICVLFWLPFYFIWIGVHWVRWLIGAVAGFSGLWALIWGWRDGNAFLLVLAIINFGTAGYFCLSSSVYFFAKRQHETRSWLHAVIVAATFILLLGTFVIGSVGLFAYQVREQADAIDFASQAAVHIYTDEDRDWLLTHSTENALAELKGPNLDAYFALMNRRPGPVLQISSPSGPVQLVYHFPKQFTFVGNLFADGKSAFGPFRLHFLIFDSGQGWQIERTWWEQLYTESPPSYK